MRIIVALGGNALLKRGEPLTAEAQRANIRSAANDLVRIATDNELVITHGNGPQVGLLALQAASYKPSEMYPLDVLGAETEGMIGYMIEQELRNRLPAERPLATLLTMVEVDPRDPAFQDPAKFIGPVYEESDARRLAEQNDWSIKPDGAKWRRVVPSPLPKRIFQKQPIECLLDNDTVVICAGGGGIPTAYNADRQLIGVEAVIDKDLSSALLARELEADLFIMATDVDGEYLGWGTLEQCRIRISSPDAIHAHDFPPGSMGPKVDAACQFARAAGRPAAIGALEDLAKILDGTSGTTISTNAEDLSFY